MRIASAILQMSLTSIVEEPESPDPSDTPSSSGTTRYHRSGSLAPFSSLPPLVVHKRVPTPFPVDSSMSGDDISGDDDVRERPSIGSRSSDRSSGSVKSGGAVAQGPGIAAMKELQQGLSSALEPPVDPSIPQAPSAVSSDGSAPVEPHGDDGHEPQGAIPCKFWPDSCNGTFIPWRNWPFFGTTTESKHKGAQVNTQRVLPLPSCHRACLYLNNVPFWVYNLEPAVPIATFQSVHYLK